MRRTSSSILNAGAPVAGVGFCWSFCVHGGQLPHVENRFHQACTGRAAGAAGVDAAGMARCESSTWPFRGASRSTRWPTTSFRKFAMAASAAAKSSERRSAAICMPVPTILLESTRNCLSFRAASGLATNRAPVARIEKSVPPLKRVARAFEDLRQLFRHDAVPDPLFDARSEARELVRRDATLVDDHRSLGHRDQSSKRLRRVVAVAHVELPVRGGKILPTGMARRWRRV